MRMYCDRIYSNEAQKRNGVPRLQVVGKSYVATSGNILLFALVCLNFLWGSSFAAETPDFELLDNRWEQLVIPANSSGLTVRAMFADDLPATNYGESWVIFRFDAQGGQYVDPGVDGMIPQGSGFWMIQTTGSVVSLDLPSNVGLALTESDAACAVSSCAEVALYSRSNRSAYNMVGSALNTMSSVDQARLKTPGGSSPCRNGCDFDEAVGFNFLFASLWRYDSSTNAYQDLSEVGNIGPWQGVWLQTGRALANTGTSLLFPAVSDGTDPGDAAAARLLAQASFGANMDSIDSVRRLGIEGWIDDQFSRQSVSHLEYGQTYFPGRGSLSGPRQHKWLIDAIEGQDQLRQRIAFAYSQIFVTSDVSENLTKTQFGMANYYDILSNYAFGNYRDLIEEVTLSPIMGIYLSMLQNAKGDPDTNTRADENFAREIMQLFSIGLYELRLNGEIKLDSSGKPIPVYTQSDIEEYARVYTGWSYNGVDVWGRIPLDGRANKILPMTQFPGYHDEGRKNLLRGAVSPAGISAEQDLDNALDSLFNHPNVGPFIGKQIIQRLVTSNPTPAYVARVARVFNNNGDGVRGDMQAVIRAILLDQEARAGHQILPNYGKLREPLLRWTHLWRAFDVQRGTESQFNQYNHASPYIYSAIDFMGQSVLSAASVFNFFHPDYAPGGALRDANLVVPEAEIYTQAYFLTSTNKISTLTQAYYQGGNENTLKSSYIDISAETALAVSSDALLDRLDLVLLSGQMSTGLRRALADHFEDLAADENGRSQRVRDAITLIMASPEYLVQK